MNKFNSNFFKEQGANSFFDLSDRIILLISSFVFLTSSYFFFTFKGQSLSTRNLDPIAQISKIKNTGQRRSSGALVWDELGKGAHIFQGDQIVTLDNSTTDIKFKNGTKFKIPENSLIKIDTIGDAFNIAVHRGVLDVLLGKDIKSINILYNNKVYKVSPDQRKFKVKMKNSDLQISSSKGKVNIVKDGKPIIIPKGVSKSLDKSVIVKKEVHRHLRLKTKLDGTSIPFKNDSIINLGWETNTPPPYRLYISKKRNFDNNSRFYETQLKSKKVKVLAPSTYYFKVTSKFEDREITSNIAVVKYVLPDSPEIIYPKDGDLVELTESSSLTFKWNNIGVNKYIFKIESDDGKKLEKKIQKNTITLKKFPSTNFTWSIKEDKKYAKWSPSQNIQIRYTGVIKIISPKEDAEIITNRPNFSIPFKWAKSKNEKDYVFKISRNNDLSSPLNTQETTKNLYTFRGKELGEFFWGLEDKKSSGIKSLVQQINVKSEIATNLVPKNKKTIHILKQSEDIKLSWKDTTKDFIREKTIVVSKNKDLKKTIINAPLKINSHILKDVVPGIYYWKILSTEADKKKHIIDSKIHHFIVKLSPKPEAPIIGDKQIMYYKKYKNKDSYQVLMPERKEDETLELSIYNKLDKNKLLFTQKTKSKYIYWHSKRHGQYYYRVRKINKQGQTSDYSKYGRLIFPISPFSE